jgi:hypothetical protein
MHALPYWRLSGYYFFYFAFIGAYSPYFGLYLQSLNFSAWDIGLLMSQMQLMRLFGPNLWGWLALRLFSGWTSSPQCWWRWRSLPFSGVPRCRWLKP